MCQMVLVFESDYYLQKNSTFENRKKYYVSLRRVGVLSAR